MKIKNGLYMLLGNSSVRLHSGVMDNGDGPLLTSWLGTCRGPAFDVVGDEEWPTGAESAIQLGIKGAKGMEALLRALGLVDKEDTIHTHIFYDNGEWVGYDEAALERVRNRSYLKVRQSMLDYFTMLSLPFDTQWPTAGDIWRHANGCEYEIDKVANQYSTREEYPATVVYQGENGKVWAKTLLNFMTKMNFVRRPDPVACEPLAVPSLDIVGIREGSIWPGDTVQDTTPQADIDLQYSPESRQGAGSDNIWHAAVQVNGKTTERVEELRSLVVEGLRVVTGNTCPDEGCPHYGTPHAHGKLRDSLDFEGLLSQYHSEVWKAAADEEERGDVGYDEVGVGTAKQLIAMFRGEAKYTHHSELRITAPFDEAAKQKFIDAWSAAGDKPLHPLIQCLHDHGDEIASRATQMQLDTLKKADPTGDHMFDRFIKKPD